LERWLQSEQDRPPPKVPRTTQGGGLMSLHGNAIALRQRVNHVKTDVMAAMAVALSRIP
jgi:hypothetical protein